MGREQQAAGAALERDLDAFHVNLSSQGWYVQRNHPKDRRTKGPPDYLAVGRVALRGSEGGEPASVLFDAKSTRSPRWSLHLLKPHQAQALDAFDKAGGVAGLYLRTTEGDAWIAWPDVRERWRRWYASGKPDALTVGDGDRVLGCDYRHAVGCQRVYGTMKIPWDGDDFAAIEAHRARIGRRAP